MASTTLRLEAQIIGVGRLDEAGRVLVEAASSYRDRARLLAKISGAKRLSSSVSRLLGDLQLCDAMMLLAASARNIAGSLEDGEQSFVVACLGEHVGDFRIVCHRQAVDVAFQKDQSRLRGS